MQDTVDQAHDAVPRTLTDIIQDVRLGAGRTAPDRRGRPRPLRSSRNAG
jgi:hypothetical protein